MKRKLGLAAWLLLLCFGVYQLQWAVEISRAQDRRNEPLYLPNGKLLHVVSLGYDNVLADLLWLYSIQYAVEEFWGQRKYEWLYHIYDLITEFDPQFEYAYVQGAMFLGMMQGRPELAIQLLDKGKRRNPRAYVYPYEQAFYAAIMMRNRQRAIDYLDEARDKALRDPAAQDVSPQIFSRLANYYWTTGNHELSLREWLRMEHASRDPKFRKIAQENMVWLLGKIAEQDPQAALRLWSEIERSTQDPEFAAHAREQRHELARQLGR